jgi:hypothetical protein
LSAAWIAALVCATLLAAVPAAAASLSSATQESTSAGVVALVTPVTLDPVSGRQVAVWSQFDGVSNKIAYARFENGVWTDFHYITFGRGHHIAPRIGVSRDGAFLFWVVDGRRYVYAPVDLSSGRLHAAPRKVPLEASGLHLFGGGSGKGTATEGGSDVPVVTEECPPEEPDCDPLVSARDDPRRQILPEGGSDVPVVTEKCPPGDADCKLLSAGNDRRRQILTEGGSDVPVVTEKCPPGHPDCNLLSAANDRRKQILSEGGSDVPVVVETESLWSVTSRPTCNLLVLSIPSAESGAYHLLRFESGRINKAGRIRLLPGAGVVLPSATAGPILDSACF